MLKMYIEVVGGYIPRIEITLVGCMKLWVPSPVLKN